MSFSLALRYLPDVGIFNSQSGQVQHAHRGPTTDEDEEGDQLEARRRHGIKTKQIMFIHLITITNSDFEKLIIKQLLGNKSMTFHIYSGFQSNTSFKLHLKNNKVMNNCFTFNIT